MVVELFFKLFKEMLSIFIFFFSLIQITVYFKNWNILILSEYVSINFKLQIMANNKRTFVNRRKIHF